MQKGIPDQVFIFQKNNLSPTELKSFFHLNWKSFIFAISTKATKSWAHQNILQQIEVSDTNSNVIFQVFLVLISFALIKN